MMPKLVKLLPGSQRQFAFETGFGCIVVLIDVAMIWSIAHNDTAPLSPSLLYQATSKVLAYSWLAPSPLLKTVSLECWKMFVFSLQRSSMTTWIDLNKSCGSGIFIYGHRRGPPRQHKDRLFRANATG
jgi:hypothetical protein